MNRKISCDFFTFIFYFYSGLFAFCVCGVEDVRFLSVQELCGGRGGRPGLPVPNSPYGLCGRKATFKEGNTAPNFMVFCTPTFEDDLFVCTQTALTLCVYTAHTQATNLPLI